MTETILIVEDDANLRDGLAYNLERAGYEVRCAETVAEALAAARKDAPDLVVLDLMLPDGSGLSVLASLREEKLAAPVIILSAIDDEVESVRGFDLGAVDYVTKPFGVSELLARIRTRLAARAEAITDRVPIGDGVANLADFLFTRGDVEQPLTPTEVELLRFLAGRAGRPVSRDVLVRAIWGLSGHSTRTLDTHVARLRKKIEPAPKKPRHLLTVHGVGYRLAP